MNRDLEALEAVLDAVDFNGACDLLDEYEPAMTQAAVLGAEAIIKARFPEDAWTTVTIEKAVEELKGLGLVEEVDGAE